MSVVAAILIAVAGGLAVALLDVRDGTHRFEHFPGADARCDLRLD